jgi:membrane fusion protein (multidrug efflux system)
MTLSRQTISIATVVVLVSLLGGGIWWRIGSGPEPGEDEPSAGTEPSAEPEDSLPTVAPAALTFSADLADPVEGAPAIRDTLWDYVHAAGIARAVLIDTVTALVDGVLDDLTVSENVEVEEGQVLATIDSTELALTAASRRAELLEARAEFEILTMFDEEEIDEPDARGERAEVTRARSGLAQAQVALRQAERQVARTTLRAPFAGRVADVVVSGGQHVTAGTVLMTVVRLDPIDVEAEVGESAVPDLVEGRSADVRFAAFPGESFSGRIRSVNPVVSSERRAVRVAVRLANPGDRIKPGMHAPRVALQARANPDVVMVPRSAILERGVGERRTMLFVFEGGLAKWRYVTVGPENDRFTAILPSEETDMVEPGEIVLTDGHHYLAHDTRVRLVESVFAAGGRPSR